MLAICEMEVILYQSVYIYIRGMLVMCASDLIRKYLGSDLEVWILFLRILLSLCFFSLHSLKLATQTIQYISWHNELKLVEGRGEVWDSILTFKAAAQRITLILMRRSCNKSCKVPIHWVKAIMWSNQKPITSSSGEAIKNLPKPIQSAF